MKWLKIKKARQRTSDTLAPAPQPAFQVDAAFGETWRLSDFTRAVELPATILLAEDDDGLRHVMTQVLQSLGYVVIPCRDAQSASEEFRSRNDIGLLLTDFQMPGKTGVELAREVTIPLPSLPVMIVSESKRTTELIREMRFRKWKFLSKPFDVAVFVEAVNLLLPQRPSASPGVLRPTESASISSVDLYIG